jgi:hypothetical protein
MHTIFELDNTTGYLNSKVEILDSQMNAMYNLASENNGKLTEKEKAEIFDQMQLPLRIAFDYFCEVSKTTNELVELVQTIFDEARLVNEKLERYESAETIAELKEDDRAQVMRFLRAYTKSREAERECE